MRTEVQRKSRVGKRLLTDDQGSEENSEVQPPAKMQLIQLPIGMQFHEFFIGFFYFLKFVDDFNYYFFLNIGGATGAMNARLSLVMADRGQND